MQPQHVLYCSLTNGIEVCFSGTAMRQSWNCLLFRERCLASTATLSLLLRTVSWDRYTPFRSRRQKDDNAALFCVTYKDLGTSGASATNAQQMRQRHAIDPSENDASLDFRAA